MTHNPHGTLNYTVPSLPTALEVCAALVKCFDYLTDDELRGIEIQVIPRNLGKFEEQCRLLLAARRALEQEGYR